MFQVVLLLKQTKNELTVRDPPVHKTYATFIGALSELRRIRRRGGGAKWHIIREQADIVTVYEGY